MSSNKASDTGTQAIENRATIDCDAKSVDPSFVEQVDCGTLNVRGCDAIVEIGGTDAGGTNEEFVCVFGKDC